MRPEPKRISILVLAAGSGRRFGGAKLAAELASQPVIRHVVRTALESPADEVAVVVGAHELEVRQSLAGLPVTFVHNPQHLAGIGTSIAAGVRAVADRADGVLIMLGDQPTVEASTVARICAAFRAGDAEIIAPEYGGVRGPPVLFAARHYAELESLGSDEGARSVLNRNSDSVEWLRIDAAYPSDVDTPIDLDRLRQAGGSGAAGEG